VIDSLHCADGKVAEWYQGPFSVDLDRSKIDPRS